MKKYKEFEETMKKLSYIDSASALLGWDQEVYMPSDANEHRAQTLSYLSSLHHTTFTDPKFGKLLNKLASSKKLSEKQLRNVQRVLKDWELSTKIPLDLVEKMSYTSSISYEAWVKAKKENDFEAFVPHLKEMIELQKKWIEAIEWKGKPYDALLHQFEEGLTMETLDSVFNSVKRDLVPMIVEATKQTSSIFPLKGMFSADSQRNYSTELLSRITYDLTRGRLDESPHPFSTAMHPTDSRITTSIDTNDLMSIWSTLHEAGHGMYEQGLLAAESHLPSGRAISLSIHESQSRFWENMIGKNLLFWRNEFTNLRDFFKEEIGEMTPESFWKSINRVEPSLIRIDADEISYHLHIIIRYEMERAIFEEGVAVEDLPALWNAKYKEYLGIDVPSDSMGILQDVHWSSGLFGYFPTYTLGSMYAAQFYDFMKREASIEDKINKKDYDSIRSWLNDHIHTLGGIYTAEEICERVTGEKLNPSHFLNYVKEKYNL